MASSFFERVNKGNRHTPDVLSCLANLSNDEVFTSPEVVNKMLDMLPQELFESRETTFLDPACKTGVFLREIAKRLLNNQLPLYQEKMELINEKKRMNIPLSIDDENFIKILNETIDHIFKKQLFGIAITELTSLLSRRSVYCSKYPNGPYSIVKFDNAEGNIRFRRVEHTWDKNGKCIYCGANKDTWEREKSLETHAYEFIHTVKPEGILNMKFDVIIGNPPYQLNDGGAQASAIPIYHKFIEQAKNLNPRFISMIIPSRWFSGGRGLEEFRKNMLSDERLKIINDYPDAMECFPGVQIKGGVNYFLWENDYRGECEINTYQNGEVISSMKRPLIENGCDVFIRNNNIISIFRKVNSKMEKSFMDIVSPMKPYGLRGDFFKNQSKYNLPPVSEDPGEDCLIIYGLDAKMKRSKRYVEKKYPIPKKELIAGYKMFMARNQGSGKFGEAFSTPIFAKPNELCTETFIVIGCFDSEKEMENCYSYIKTKFFRTMVGVRKNDQGAGQNIYKYVPMQDFTKPWTDEILYKKYNLTEEEIEYIEENVLPME